MIGQTGLNGFDLNPAAGFGLLILMVPLLFGGLFGALAIVSAAERGTNVGPIILAFVAISSTAVVFFAIPRVFRGFDFGTFMALIPLLLGSWAIFEVATRSTKATKSKVGQYPLRSILNVVFCISLAIAIMAFSDRQFRFKERAYRVLELLTHARMVVSTPVVPDADPEAVAILGIGPDKAIELCNEAIELAPNNGEAYNIRATAYEQKGEAQSARQDRLRAEELGYRTSAASDTEQTDEPER
jgi:hypothetical protein